MRFALISLALLAGCQTTSILNVGPKDPVATFETIAWPQSVADATPIVDGNAIDTVSIEEEVLAPTRVGTRPDLARYRGRYKGDVCKATQAEVRVGIGRVSNTDAQVYHARRTQADEVALPVQSSTYRVTPRGLDNGSFIPGTPYILVALRPDGNLNYAFTTDPTKGVCYGVLQRTTPL